LWLFQTQAERDGFEDKRDVAMPALNASLQQKKIGEHAITHRVMLAIGSHCFLMQIT
jgi:hypothetical protein